MRRVRRFVLPGGGALLLLLLASIGWAQPRWSVVGEVGVTSGVVRLDGAGGAAVHVPLGVGVRLDVSAALPGASRLYLTAEPSLQLTDASTSGAWRDVAFVHGLTEAFVLVPVGAWDLQAGLQRWPLGELRLIPLAMRDRAVGAGDPRGVWGLRATGFLHPWRIEVGATLEAGAPDAPYRVPSANALHPSGLGAAASVRYDAPGWTLSGHAHGRTARVVGEEGVVALGASLSSTLDAVVVVADAWWLVPASQLRAGVGLRGYAGDVLWTVEAAWAPRDPHLAADPASSSLPMAKLQASVPLDAAHLLDASVGVAWPLLGEGQERTTEVDGTIAWRWERRDDALFAVTRLASSPGQRNLAMTVGWTGYF